MLSQSMEERQDFRCAEHVSVSSRKLMALSAVDRDHAADEPA